MQNSYVQTKNAEGFQIMRGVFQISKDLTQIQKFLT